MKNFKNILTCLFGLLSIALITTSCNDEFTEKDLLELQVQLGNEKDSLNAVRQLAALNAAGELVSYQIKTVDTDGVGVEGLEVTLGAASSDGTADNQTLTTDASGTAYFNRVAIGGNNLTITGANIMDANLTLDFGSIQQGVHYQIVNSNIIPMPVTENSVITVLGAASATATVQGTVIIETDVTNTTPEIPQDVVLRANFDDNLAINTSISIQYFFATNNDALDLGTAAVDNATGAYSITVPAGIGFNVVIPNVQADQTVAVNDINNENLARPEFRVVPTNFGKITSTDNVPNVIGAWVVFDAPPVPGDGFTFGSFARVPRDLQTLSLDSDNGDPITTPFEGSNDIVTQFTNLGDGYTGSPTVTVTDATTGADAYVEAWIELAITGLSLTSAGTGYADNTTYFFDLVYDEITDADGTVNLDQIADLGILGVDTDGSGVFLAAAVASALTDAIANGDPFFDVADRDQIFDNVSNLRLVNTAATTDAIIGITSTNGRVFALEVMDSGNGQFTGPSFAFTGGGATTQAAMSVLQFGTQWTVDVDNLNTTAYPLLPLSMDLEYVSVSTFDQFPSQTSEVDNQETGNDADFDELLTVDSNGDIQWVDQTATYVTSFFADEMPRAIIVGNAANIAGASITTGQIDDTDGSVSGMGFIFTGDGYADRFGVTIEPTIAGAPGTGVVVEIDGGAFLTTGEYNWFGGSNMLNEGSGFVDNLNQVGGPRNFSISTGGTSFNLQAGDTRIMDIDFGTGNKTGVIN